MVQVSSMRLSLGARSTGVVLLRRTSLSETSASWDQMACVPIRTVLQKCPCANQWLVNGDSHKLLLDSQGVTVKEGWWRPLTAARIASQQGQWIIDHYFYPFICTLSKKRFWGDVMKQYKIKKKKWRFGCGDGKSSNIDLKTWIFLSLLGASSASSLGLSPGSWKPWLINAYGKY